MIDIKTWILTKIGTDKLLHYAFCGWIVSFFDDLLWQVVVGILLGVLMEFFDRYVRKTTFDVYDMLWTWGGAATTILIKFLI